MRLRYYPLAAAVVALQAAVWLPDAAAALIACSKAATALLPARARDGGDSRL